MEEQGRDGGGGGFAGDRYRRKLRDIQSRQLHSAASTPRFATEQLVEIYVGEGDQPYQTTSYLSYVELRDRNEVLSGLAAYGITQFKLGVANEVEQIWGEAVSGNYFDVLGVPAHKGRTFLPEEDRCRARTRLPSSAIVCGKTIQFRS